MCVDFEGWFMFDIVLYEEVVVLIILFCLLCGLNVCVDMLCECIV